jgi:hypothetical protein
LCHLTAALLLPYRQLVVLFPCCSMFVIHRHPMLEAVVQEKLQSQVILLDVEVVLLVNSRHHPAHGQRLKCPLIGRDKAPGTVQVGLAIDLSTCHTALLGCNEVWQADKSPARAVWCGQPTDRR